MLQASQHEKVVPADTFLVSKTDTKGIITYVNEAFVSISGYSRDELIGSPHNIVRHPDMPKEAFADMWACLKAGRPWRGIVKNRCKDGSFYWVHAFAAPEYKNDTISGYISVRSRPDQNSISSSAALYREIIAGRASLSKKFDIWRSGSIKLRIGTLVAAFALCAGAIAGASIWSTGRTGTALQTLHDHSLVASSTSARIADAASDSRAQILLCLQHSPGSPLASMHDHPLEMHLEKIASNERISDTLIEELKKLATPSTADAIDDVAKAKRDFFDNGIAPALSKMRSGHFLDANAIILQQVNPKFSAYQKAHQQLTERLASSAEHELKAAEQRADLIAKLAYGALALCAIVILQSILWLYRAIGLPLQELSRQFRKMAQGDLRGQIEIGRQDDFGALSESLAIMQAHLKAMVGEIKVSTRAIDHDSGQIAKDVRTISTHSMDQQSMSASIAAATEEFSQSVNEVADHAQRAATIAGLTNQRVEDARHGMEKSIESTNRVVQTVMDSSRQIAALEQVISSVSALTSTIKDIADQTNLLALNAAIEAARAGEQGRGFAVVADEVRKLAERTGKATGEINAMVSEIGKVTAHSVDAISRVVADVEHAAAEINGRIHDLEEISERSTEMRGMADAIASAAHQQATASEDIASRMEQIAQLIDSNMKHVQEASDSSSLIVTRADRLRKLSDSFDC